MPDFKIPGSLLIFSFPSASHTFHNLPGHPMSRQSGLLPGYLIRLWLHYYKYQLYPSWQSR